MNTKGKKSSGMKMFRSKKKGWVVKQFTEPSAIIWIILIILINHVKIERVQLQKYQDNTPKLTGK